MPSYHATIAVPSRSVTPLTNGSATAARVQALGPGSIRVQATPTNVAPAPSAFGGAIECQGGYTAGIDTSRTLAEHFPGVIAGGATGFLWGYTESSGMQASCSHA